MLSPRHAVCVAAAVLAALVLAGCTPTPSPEPTLTPTSTPSPGPSNEPLTCDGLAPAELVGAVLTGADGVAPQPVPAVQATTAMLALELAAAGGLNCSWRTGPVPQSEFDGSGEVAYLSVRVLPNAASQYQPVWAGDAPSTETREVGDVTASTAFGEVGWRLAAPVGDAWVELHLAAPGLGTVGSVFDGVNPDTVLDRLAELAAPVFSTLATASPGQLAWPRSESMRQGDAICNGGLNPQGIGMALGAGVIEAEASDPTSAPPRSFHEAAAAAARSFTCDYLVDGVPGPHVTFLVGAGGLFDVLKQADLATTFEPLDLSAIPSYAAGDEALRAIVTDGPASPVYLKVGNSVYEIESHDGPTAVAEAILAQIR